MRLFCRATIILALIIASTTSSHAQSHYQRGPFTAKEAHPAPEWTVSKWVRGPASTLKDSRGQVVVIDFFQLWCPGCKSFSIPLMGNWEKTFAKEIKQQKLKLISIHTVFEGHAYQTDERLLQFVEERQMRHPVAVDFLPTGSRLPKTMIDYQTRGTPEISIIDKNGRIRFQKIGSFDPEWATGFIRQLLLEDTEGRDLN